MSDTRAKTRVRTRKDQTEVADVVNPPVQKPSKKRSNSFGSGRADQAAPAVATPGPKGAVTKKAESATLSSAGDFVVVTEPYKVKSPRKSAKPVVVTNRGAIPPAPARVVPSAGQGDSTPSFNLGDGTAQPPVITSITRLPTRQEQRQAEALRLRDFKATSASRQVPASVASTPYMAPVTADGSFAANSRPNVFADISGIGTSVGVVAPQVAPEARTVPVPISSFDQWVPHFRTAPPRTYTPHVPNHVDTSWSAPCQPTPAATFQPYVTAPPHIVMGQGTPYTNSPNPAADLSWVDVVNQQQQALTENKQAVSALAITVQEQFKRCIEVVNSLKDNNDRQTNADQLKASATVSGPNLNTSTTTCSASKRSKSDEFGLTQTEHVLSSDSDGPQNHDKIKRKDRQMARGTSAKAHLSFDGADWYTFINHFRVIARKYEWNDVECCRRLLGALSGKAIGVTRNRQVGEMNYQQLEKYLEGRFGQHKPRVVVYTALKKKPRQPDEDWDDYIDRLRGIADKMNVPEDDRDPLLTSAFQLQLEREDPRLRAYAMKYAYNKPVDVIQKHIMDYLELHPPAEISRLMVCKSSGTSEKTIRREDLPEKDDKQDHLTELVRKTGRELEAKIQKLEKENAALREKVDGSSRGRRDDRRDDANDERRWSREREARRDQRSDGQGGRQRDDDRRRDYSGYNKGNGRGAFRGKRNDNYNGRGRGRGQYNGYNGDYQNRWQQNGNQYQDRWHQNNNQSQDHQQDDFNNSNGNFRFGSQQGQPPAYPATQQSTSTLASHAVNQSAAPQFNPFAAPIHIHNHSTPYVPPTSATGGVPVSGATTTRDTATTPVKPSTGDKPNQAE